MNITMGTQFWRIGALVASVLTVALIFQQAGAAELKTWRNGIVQAKSDAGFIFMASRRGFAHKQGLKTEMDQFKGDAIALKALLAGELDSYEGNPGGPMIALSHGAKIKLVGCFWPGLTYGLFAKDSIRSPQDLKGKSFAISGPGALPDLLARAVLEKYNIPASDVRFVIMGSDSDRFKALSAGVVDVAAASTEFVPSAASHGLKLFVDAHDAVPNYLRFCIYMSPETIATRKDEAARFLASEMAGLRYALAHRDEEIGLTREVTGAKPDDPRPAYVFDEVVRYSAIDPTMSIPMDKLNWMENLLVKTGNLPKPIDVSMLVDESVRIEALKLVDK